MNLYKRDLIPMQLLKPNLRELLIISSLPLILVCLTSCAGLNRNISASIKLPSSIHTVAVQMFKNDTYQYGMEEKLTNLVIEELLADGRIKVINNPETADAVLSGRIINYFRENIAADRSGVVDLYRITLTASVTLKQTKPEKIIRQAKQVTVTTTYVPKRSRIEFEKEQDARTRLLSDLAEEIVYLILYV